MARSKDSQPLTSETLLDVHFAKAGLDVSAPAAKQPRRPTGDYGYFYTCAAASNVRAFEAKTNRLRGGSRPGLAKYVPQAVGGVTGWIVQELNLVVAVGIDPPGGAMQQSQSGRVVTLVGVTQGNVYTVGVGDTAWHAATNNATGNPPLIPTGIVYSADNGQKLWFADGTNYVVYNPATDTVDDWVASAGTLPADGDSNTPRLICNWRNRIVLSGLIGDPQNWFMAKAGDPTNFDYAPLSPSAIDAVAGNNSPAGTVGDVVTALIPYSDDLLIFGGDHTIYQCSGDPADGGRIDRVSDSIGMAWGRAWCKGSAGEIYFLTNKGGFYRLVPGSKPEQLSQSVQKRLQDIDTGANNVILLWDETYQGVHMFVTPLAGPGVSDHWFYEARTNAFWPVRLARTDFDPLCGCVVDGNSPNDRQVVIGSWDGYVRNFDPDSATDDGRKFTSSVTLGPILTKNFDDMLVKDLQAVLSADAGTVTFEVLVGKTAEAALASNPVYTGTWTAARSTTQNIRRAGHAVYLRLSSTDRWAMESVRARFAGRGMVRMREGSR